VTTALYPTYPLPTTASSAPKRCTALGEKGTGFERWNRLGRLSLCPYEGEDVQRI
jgi:hypothetical protein